MLKKISIPLFILAVIFSACNKDTDLIGDVELMPTTEHAKTSKETRISVSSTQNNASAKEGVTLAQLSKIKTLEDLVRITNTEESIISKKGMLTSLESRSHDGADGNRGNGGNEKSGFNWFNAGVQNNWYFEHNVAYNTPDFHQWGIGFYQFSNIFNITPPVNLQVQNNYLPDDIDFGNLDIPWHLGWGLNEEEYGNWLEDLFVNCGAYNNNGGFDWNFGGFDWANIGQFNNYHFPDNCDFGDVDFFSWSSGLFQVCEYNNVQFPAGFDFHFPVNFMPIDLNLAELAVPLDFYNNVPADFDWAGFNNWLEILCSDYEHPDSSNPTTSDYDFDLCENLINWDFPDCSFGDQHFFDWNIQLFDYCQNNGGLIPYGLQFPANFFPNNYNFNAVQFPANYNYGNLNVADYGNWLNKVAIDFGGHQGYAGGAGGAGSPGYGGAWGYDWANVGQWNNYHINQVDFDFNDINFHNWSIGLYQYDNDFGNIDFGDLQFPHNFVFDGFDFDIDIVIPGGIDCHIDVPDYTSWLEDILTDCGAYTPDSSNPTTSDYDFDLCENLINWDFPDCSFGDQHFFDWNIQLFDYCQNNGGLIPYGLQFPANFFPNNYNFNAVQFPANYNYGNLNVADYGNWLNKVAIDFGGHQGYAGGAGGAGSPGYGGAWGYDWANVGQWNNYHINQVDFDFNDINFHNWSIGLYQYDNDFGNIDFGDLQFPHNFVFDGFDFDIDIVIPGGIDCHIDVPDYTSWLENLLTECGALVELGGWNDYDWNNCGNWNNYNFPGAHVFNFGDVEFIDWSVGLYNYCQQNNIYVPQNFNFPQNYCPQWNNININIPANYQFPANVNADAYQNWLTSFVYFSGH